ncbi:HAE1 family hydrophobic/amphiphilic exporter-1 [Paracoccus versutus]|uniref:HAE1 family hydrophobic/amphiphilic exporter-1 n=1 Tax=Paracoccus versutus TaxID=34007 RepID=A0AAQ0HDR7_PARVE|nr:hypothetical protein [Paracoccus versutus]REG28331.1 HAE1 family hydrophobic/amphiphilic exporter-1 [Paracoccus versutus]
MAYAMIGGLISFTILTLVVMPVILSYIDSVPVHPAVPVESA